MLRTVNIEMSLIPIEPGIFQKVCNEILCKKGYIPYKYTGSVKGSNKTKLGTPDSVFIDSEQKYVYVEITTQKEKIDSKIEDDVKKCLKKINENPILSNKISKIIFFHNNDNPEEAVTEKIKEMCGNIKFEIYGISYLSSILQNECKEIAISLLNVRDDSQTVSELSQESINQLVDAIISDENKQKLKQIYNNLKIFDFYYDNQNRKETQLYYHNMLVILSKSNSKEGIEFYNKIPSFAKNNVMNHFYAIILIENEKYDVAKEIIENLYYNQKYEDSFETLVRIYFLMENYDKVIELLSKCKIENFDRYGFLASMLIISKNKKKRYQENELIKLNNSKFRKMPLLYSCTAKMLYNINKRNKKYKDQFKKGLRLLNEKDIIAISVMCNEAMVMGLEQEAISFLESINLTPVLKNKLLELLSRKGKLTKEQIRFVENIDKKFIDKKIDMNYIYGEVCESRGKELEAIKFYKESFEKFSNIIAGCKYIQLSIKNKSKIDDKYTYFAHIAFNYVRIDKHIEFFTSDNNNVEEAIEQLRQKMIEINKSTNKKLDIYQENKCIPLSGLMSREKNFEEYIKIINTLLFDNDRVLLCGETIDINLDDGFVLDISSIIVLTLLDMLELIPDSFCEKIYITTSLKNKFQYFYEMLVKKQEKTESFLYLTDNEQLSLNETPIIEQIRFWKKLYNYINRFNAIDVEAEKDEFLNDKTIDFLDKIQFDLIMLAKKEGLPFISDDLMIRKIANNYEIKHTNSMQIVKSFSKSHDEYISNFIKYSKCNYIYTLYPDTLLEISKDLYENFNEVNKHKFVSIIESVMENKVSAEYYVPILLERIESLKGVQYIQVFDNVYENLFASFFINDIDKLIENKCNEKQIDIKNIYQIK